MIRLQDQMEEWNKRDWELHEKAGLVFSGYDESGDAEWIGTSEQWRRYEELDLETL